MKRKRTLKYISLGVIIVFICAFILLLDIPNWKKLDVSKIYDISLASHIYGANGELISSLHSGENRDYVSLAELPDYVPAAFVSVEDARFYEHRGIDVRRIFGALYHDIKTLSLSQGASTITQQLIKLTHLSAEKTLSRKAQEAYLAVMLERQMTKPEILEAYLNIVYFGNGAYGIGTAAKKYFGVSASELTLSQAATLAGVIKSPSAYAPHIDAAAALARRDYVLSKMREYGHITPQTETQAAQEELNVITRESSGGVGWYSDAAADEAADILNIGVDALMTGGYRIYTAFDSEIQATVDAVIGNPQFYPDAGVQGAMVVMDVQTGAIIAIAGGREYAVQRGLNRALDSRRQPGSAIKPISTYAAAIDRYGYMPTSALYDVLREYANGYSPGNASGKFYGEVTMRAALSRSMNAATVDLADAIGIKGVAKYARAFGLEINGADENLSLALGSMAYGVTPVELCAAYCALGNGGVLNAPRIVLRIDDKFGTTIYRNNGEGVRAVSPETAYVITDMLKTAVTGGTATALSGTGLHISAKTGTNGLENGDTADAWTIAYTPEICAVAWIGKDTNANGGMASWVSGGGHPAHMCRALFDGLRGKLSDADFDMPSGLTGLVIDAYALDNENRVLLASPDTPRKYCARELFRTGADNFPVSDIWDAPVAIADLTLNARDGAPEISFTSQSDYAQYLLIRTVNGASEIIADLTAPKGENITYIDEGIGDDSLIYYSIVPRHLLLYDIGVTKLGARGNVVMYNPGGLFNEIAALFERGEYDEIEIDINSLFR